MPLSGPVANTRASDRGQARHSIGFIQGVWPIADLASPVDMPDLALPSVCIAAKPLTIQINPKA